MDNTNLKRYHAAPNYIHRMIGGKHVLISVGENIANFNGFIQLNETAAFLWGKLSQPCTLEELCTSLCEEYDISREIAEIDTLEMLKTGIKNGMVLADG